MNRLLLILILTFSFQSLTKADDIKDFQIEGMSIGDSALDYYSKSIIKSNKTDFGYKDDKFYGVLINIKSNKFDQIQLHFKTNDINYKIHAIGGIKGFNDNIDNCYSLKKEIELDIKNLFKNAKFFDQGKLEHPGDNSGKSFVTQAFYSLDNGVVSIACYDLAKEFNSDFRLIVNSNEINEWYDVAYN
jgi:hypothetical protein|tara:strand:+ start:840 stop:1403 length:564 start_codon:yes stop_codon:yes gene_type:complete